MVDACGTDFCVTYDPAGAAVRRVANMTNSGLKAISNFDRDEAPMAVFQESVGASVRYVTKTFNRSLGAYIGINTRGLSPGDVVRIIVKGL